MSGYAIAVGMMLIISALAAVASGLVAAREAYMITKEKFVLRPGPSPRKVFRF
jgi:hypothetical protein